MRTRTGLISNPHIGATQCLKQVHGAFYARWSAIQDVGIYHSGFQVGMAEQLLDRPDIVPVFQEVGRERMAETVAGGALFDARPGHGLRNSPLNNGRIDMVATLNPVNGISPATVLRKHPLPKPRTARIGIFLGQRLGNKDLAPAFGEINRVNPTHVIQMPFQGLNQREGQHSSAVFRALPVPNDDLHLLEIDILDAEGYTLVDAKAGTVHDPGGKEAIPEKVVKDASNFLTREHDRKMHGLLGAYNISQFSDGAGKNLFHIEENRGKRLVLR